MISNVAAFCRTASLKRLAPFGKLEIAEAEAAFESQISALLKEI
jgi:hypothetical protein